MNGRHEEGGLDSTNIERNNAGRLCQVDYQRYPPCPTCLPDAYQVNITAVRPANIRIVLFACCPCIQITQPYCQIARPVAQPGRIHVYHGTPIKAARMHWVSVGLATGTFTQMNSDR